MTSIKLLSIIKVNKHADDISSRERLADVQSSVITYSHFTKSGSYLLQRGTGSYACTFLLEKFCWTTSKAVPRYSFLVDFLMHVMLTKRRLHHRRLYQKVCWGDADVPKRERLFNSMVQRLKEKSFFCLKKL